MAMQEPAQLLITLLLDLSVWLLIKLCRWLETFPGGHDDILLGGESNVENAAFYTV